MATIAPEGQQSVTWLCSDELASWSVQVKNQNGIRISVLDGKASAVEVSLEVMKS